MSRPEPRRDDTSSLFRGRWRVVVAGTVLAATVLFALLGPFLAPHGPGAVMGMPYGPAGGMTPLGTDHLGADVLSRFLTGGRSLMLLSLAALAVAYALGTSAGMLAALRGGQIDTAVLRAADVLLSLPSFLLLSVTVAALGRGAAGVGIATAVVLLPEIARVVRAATLQALQHDYVEAALARGERTAYVLTREVLPNLAPVLAAGVLGGAIALPGWAAPASAAHKAPQHVCASAGAKGQRNASCDVSR